MRVSDGIKEQDVVVGNTYDKYGSKNPIIQKIMKVFDDNLSELVIKANPDSIHEVGCGEGYWTLKFTRKGIPTQGTDFSQKVITIAQQNAKRHEIEPNIFAVKSIYDLDPNLHGADLIICCEVLEHLENPIVGLGKLQAVVGRHLIVSVPREPAWRILNMLSGRYLASFGNTPGHIQHWSTSSFTKLIQKHFDVIESRTPLPWTMLLCRPRL